MIDQTDPAFVASAHAWARDAAGRTGARVSGTIEQIHVRPWSTVFRVPTTSGTLYLKCCGTTQRHEPRLSALLQETMPGCVPEVIAVHDALPWMLVAEGGEKLRDARSGSALLASWRELLPRCAELQRALAGRVDTLLDLGTPDHRTAALVRGLERAVDDEAGISGDREDRLTPAERDRLRHVAATLVERSRELTVLGIPDTIQHDDLHDGNVLVRDGRTVIFDWGDACVSHPFFTLTVTLRVAAFRSGLEEDAPEMGVLRDAYLEPWAGVASREDLVRGAELARRVGQVSRALTWDAVAMAYPDAGPVKEGFAATLRLVLELLDDARAG